MPSRGSQPYVKKAVADLSGNKHPISIIYEKRGGPTTLMHPTEKPVELMRYLVRTYTNQGDVVLDPCCGSGTTCLAAWMEGRQSIGIEKDKQYAEISKSRTCKICNGTGLSLLAELGGDKQYETCSCRARGLGV